MKKRIIALILATALALTLVACGSAAAPAASTGTASSAAASSVAASTGKDIKVGLVTDVGGVNDGSFNQSAWTGLQKAGTDLGIEVNYLESKTDADYAPNIQNFLDEDYDLIICVGYMLADSH